MRDDTKRLHDHLISIGTQLGFHARPEVPLDAQRDSYSPRLDVLWSLPLSAAQLAALKRLEVLTGPLARELPIAAWEVEGSDASTKTMQADLANLRLSGAPYGFLAAKGGSKDNLYSRARVLTKTQSAYFGAQGAVALDAQWIPELAALRFEASPHKLTGSRGKDDRAGGGEGTRIPEIRRTLRAQGEKAGFIVHDSFQSPEAKRGENTQSQIDQVWALPMPISLETLVAEITTREKSQVDRWKKARKSVAEVVDPPKKRFEQVVVVGFEIENDAGKHCRGGLLNLASHCMSGVLIAGNTAALDAANRARETYKHVFNLSRVSVFGGFVQ